MAEIDISNLKYKIAIITEAEEIMPLNNFIQSCTWQDQNKELSQRASITLANTKTEQGFLHELLPLCTGISIQAAGKQCFKGIIWEWEYTSALQKNIQITAYDRMMYLTKSKGNSYYTAGKSTSAIVQDICSQWGIDCSYNWTSITHTKTPYKNKTISDQIITTLDECQRKTDSKYVAIMVDDVFEIKARGSNSDVFIFTPKSIMSTKDRFSMINLITNVAIGGKEDKEGRIRIEDNVPGDTKYGLLQEVINRDSNTTLADARAEAQQLINDKGKPEETISIESIDIPFLRKGDKVKIKAGNLLDTFYVTSITHDAVRRTMNMEVER